VNGDKYSISIDGDVSGVVGAGGELQQEQIRTAQDRPEPKLKILFLAANPVDTNPLRLGEEVRTIDERLRGTDFRDQIELVQHWAVRITDLSEALLRHDPDIVHFSGHGSSVGSVILENQDRSSAEVESRTLAELFRIAAKKTRCLVLNACYSAAQAARLTASIDCVVGTAKAIGDDAAIHFAGGFYRGLGYGQSLQASFDLGRNEIDLASLGEEKTPQLLHRSDVDPSLIQLVGAP